MKLNNKNKNSSNINNNLKDNSKIKGESTQKENSSRYGIKSNQCPPQRKDIIAFEEDMIDLVRRAKTLKQRKDFKATKSSNKTLTSAGKTLNMYKLTKDEYNHLLDNGVTATYKKATKGIEDIINEEGITSKIFRYAKRADMFDRIEMNGASNCFITLKDYKENFFNYPTTRLISPAKDEIGRISKSILDKIYICLCKKLKLNEWKNTTDVNN